MESGDIMEAETLCRKCLRINEKIYGTKHHEIVRSAMNLCYVHPVGENYDDKRKAFLEHCLAINTRRNGIDDSITATVNASLAVLHSGISN